MAKVNKIEMARQEGIDFAYRMIKQQGLDALERRIDRNKKTFSPAFLDDKQLDQFCYETKENCLTTLICMSSIVLADKFGFGAVRLQRFVDAFTNYADSIGKGLITYNDIYGVLKEEYKIDVVDMDKGKSILNKIDSMLSEGQK